MPVSISKKSHFGDVILRALMAVEGGQMATAVFALSGGDGVETATVGGVWMGDVFSWRLVPHAQTVVLPGEGVEIYAGMGHEHDVLIAAARLTYSLAEAANGGDWALLD